MTKKIFILKILCNWHNIFFKSIDTVLKGRRKIDSLYRIITNKGKGIMLCNKDISKYKNEYEFCDYLNNRIVKI